jgi:hypothetical protein
MNLETFLKLDPSVQITIIVCAAIVTVVFWVGIFDIRIK